MVFASVSAVSEDAASAVHAGRDRCEVVQDCHIICLAAATFSAQTVWSHSAGDMLPIIRFDVGHMLYGGHNTKSN